MTEEKEREKREAQSKVEIEAGVCFVCRGAGHWARECTSLPGIYLTEDAPRCYRCNGVGHFARFCPNSEKQWRLRERRASLPVVFPDPPDWGTYFDDLAGMVAFPEQMLFIRPEYPSPESVHNSVSDGGSHEDYIIDGAEGAIPDLMQINKAMVDTAIEANKNQ